MHNLARTIIISFSSPINTNQGATYTVTQSVDQQYSGRNVAIHINVTQSWDKRLNSVINFFGFHFDEMTVE